MPERRSCNIHSGVAGSYDIQAVAKREHVRICQVVDREVDISEALAFNVKSVRPPHARSDENSIVAVAEHIVNGYCNADCRVRTYLYAEREQKPLVSFDVVLRKAKLWYAVAKYTTDLFARLEQRDVISLTCKQYGYRHSGRASAYDAYPLAVLFYVAEIKLLKVVVAYVMLNVAEMHGCALLPENAVSLTLIFVIADERAYYTERVVFKKHISRFVDISIKKGSDYRRDSRAYRAAVLT